MYIINYLRYTKISLTLLTAVMCDRECVCAATDS